MRLIFVTPWFQSTYLYKVRRPQCGAYVGVHKGFNPRTYIRYDDRKRENSQPSIRFNPRTYIRYDKKYETLTTEEYPFQSTDLYKVRQSPCVCHFGVISFNPRTYIRYDVGIGIRFIWIKSFNPRTYIRYDLSLSVGQIQS